MSFEIMFYDGQGHKEVNEYLFDFDSVLYEDEFDEDGDIINRTPLSKATGFIMDGDVEEVYYASDVDGDTFVEGYIKFLGHIDDLQGDFGGNSLYKILVIKRLDAMKLGKGYGTKLLELLKNYAKTSGIEHIVLIADEKSEVNLEKYYKKVGFHKLPYNNWIYFSQDFGEEFEKALLKFNEQNKG